MNCIYCSNQLPEKGFFCPTCFKQTKCKNCNEDLIKDSPICVFCGEEIGVKKQATNLNSIEFSETEKGRNFKAAFTDKVGQSISETFGMIIANRIVSKGNSNNLSLTNNVSKNENTEDAEVVILKNNVKDGNLDDIPSLKEIKIKDLAKTETDWILVYSYYASSGGSAEFTRDDIVDLYVETSRKTEARTKTLSQLIRNLIKGSSIKATNNTHFILLPKGVEKVKDIFSGNSSARIVKRNTQKANTTAVQKSSKIKDGSVSKIKGKKNNSIDFIDLKLSITEQTELKAFFELKKPKSQNEKVILAIKWYTDLRKVEEVSLEEMNYLLSIAAEVPSALPQVLSNIIGTHHWITKGTKGKYKLSSIGENYIQNKLPK